MPAHPPNVRYRGKSGHHVERPVHFRHLQALGCEVRAANVALRAKGAIVDPGGP
jgi:hypothetical protein